jgi:diaminopimelate decarboxylase
MSHPLAPDWLAEPADANQAVDGVWPDTLTRNARGEIEVGGVAVSQLARVCGTPLYVLDGEDLRHRARAVKSALTDPFQARGMATTVYYATKALLAADVLRIVADEGYGADVSTMGELEWALGVGMDPAHIEFLGNNKSLPEIRRAVEAGVGTIVLDSYQEIDRVNSVAQELSVIQRVAIRVNTGVHATTHDYLATAREDQKFGIARSDLASASDRIAQSDNLRLVGLHSHIGSQIFAADGFIEAATRLLEEYATLSAEHPLDTVNLGGGFGIPYTAADPTLDLAELATSLADAVVATCERLEMALPHVAFEPGRSVVGTSGVTLYEVGTTKQVAVTHDDGDEAVRLYVSVDGGMSDNLRAALYRADYTPLVANRRSAEQPALVRVVGKHCESGDIVVDAAYLPGDVHPGDLLVVAATGAYCHSLSSNYNSVGRPAMVIVDGGDIHTALRAETLDDLRARDLGLGLRRHTGEHS